MNSAILVAAGSSTRMGSGVDKLFLEVAGQPLIAHAWQRLNSNPLVDELVIVVREDMRARFQDLAVRFAWRKPFRLTAGGKERQDSVWNGLQQVKPAAEIVLIQDAARPCTPASLIAGTIQAAREVGAAVAAHRVTDTIKESDGSTFVERTLDRSRLWAVQTPQTFQIDVLRRGLALARERGLHVTDDTAVCELIGQPVKLVECLLPNPKVTSPSDLAYVQQLLTRDAEAATPG